MNTHDQASELLIQGLNDAMQRLRLSNANKRRLEAIQQPAMPVLCGAADTADRPAQKNKGANHAKASSSAS